MQTIVFSIFVFLASYLFLKLLMSEMAGRPLDGIFETRRTAPPPKQRPAKRRTARRKPRRR